MLELDLKARRSGGATSPTSLLVADMAHCWREARMRVYGEEPVRPLQPKALRDAANQWHASHHPPPPPPPQTALKRVLAATANIPQPHHPLAEARAEAARGTQQAESLVQALDRQQQQLSEVREAAARDTQMLQQEVMRLHAALAGVRAEPLYHLRLPQERGGRAANSRARGRGRGRACH